MPQITKVVLHSSQIDSQQVLLSDDADPELLRLAESVARRLRAGEPSVTVSLPNWPDLTIGLTAALVYDGLEAGEEAADDDCENLDVEGIEINRPGGALAYYLEFYGDTAAYFVLPSGHTEIDEIGLYGTVAGSIIAGREDGESVASPEYIDAADREIQAVVDQIVALTPVYIAPTNSTDPRFVFGNYVALAAISGGL